MRHVKPWLLLAAVLALAMTAVAHGAGKPPERAVTGTTITSAHDPAVTITLPKAATYVGAARWDLYNCCDAELHLFVEADKQKNVQRLYWVQFEAYLPNNDYTYDYPFTEKTTLDGREFDLNFRLVRTDRPVKPGSDYEKVRELLGTAGFKLPVEMMQVRLVHLLDEARRKELMFIYAEDPGADGGSAEKLDDTEGEAGWQTLTADLLERAKSRIHLH